MANYIQNLLFYYNLASKKRAVVNKKVRPDEQFRSYGRTQ